MFISQKTANRLIVEFGFGKTIVSALCNWYDASKANFESLKGTDLGHALWAFLDSIADDEDALCIFILDNFMSSEGSSRFLELLSGIMPQSYDTRRLDVVLEKPLFEVSPTFSFGPDHEAFIGRGEPLV